jgi:tRNA dimethylallyltransferase
MQVYKEIPVTTNQARNRPAKLAGVVSVTEEWTVARHKERAERIVNSLPPDLPFVLDAGTGMYLNALVLDVPLAPKVPGELRAEAALLATGARNPRREARELELEMAGKPRRGSIWDGSLRYDAAFVYLRPPREVLDDKIRVRSKNITHGGGAQEEARTLLDAGLEPNPSVREAIGVREMLLHATGSLSMEEAEDAIAARTRRLARRQMRWFDKLAKTLENTAPILVVEDPDDEKLKHLMHGKIVA